MRAQTCETCLCEMDRQCWVTGWGVDQREEGVQFGAGFQSECLYGWGTQGQRRLLGKMWLECAESQVLTKHLCGVTQYMILHGFRSQERDLCYRYSTDVIRKRHERGYDCPCEEKQVNVISWGTSTPPGDQERLCLPVQVQRWWGTGAVWGERKDRQTASHLQSSQANLGLKYVQKVRPCFLLSSLHRKDIQSKVNE